MSRATTLCSVFVLAALAGLPTLARGQGQAAPSSQSPEARRPIDFNLPHTRQQAEVERVRRTAARDAVRRVTRLTRDVDRIDDPPSRVRVRAHIAGALWARDSATARALLVQAFDEIKLCATGVPRARRVSPDQDELLLEVLRIAQEHDALFAHHLVALAVDPSNMEFVSRERSTYESRRSIALVQNAYALIATDPALAEQTARESLRGGITSNFSGVIERLTTVDPKLAGNLLDAAIARIGTEDVAPPEIYDLAMFLVRDSLDPKRFGEKSPDAPRADKTVAQRFLDAAAAATERFVTTYESRSAKTPGSSVPFDSAAFGGDAPDVEEIAGSFFSMMTDLLPAYEQYDVERLSAARALVERAGRLTDTVSREHMYVFYGNGDTPESLAAEAEASTDSRSRSELFDLAVQLAMSQHDYDKARSIVQRVGESAKRKRLEQDIVVDLIFQAEQAGRYDEVRMLLVQLPHEELRATMAGHVLVQAMQQGRCPEVALIEQETVTLLESGRDVSPALAAETLLQLARCHTNRETDRAFDLAAAGVVAANSAARNPVDVDAYVRTGRQPPFDSLSWIGVGLNVFEGLARADYFRALRLAKSIVDPALSIEAQLVVVRAALPPVMAPVRPISHREKVIASGQ